MRQRQLGQQARQRRTWALALAEAQQAPTCDTERGSRNSRHARRPATLTQR